MNVWVNRALQWTRSSTGRDESKVMRLDRVMRKLWLEHVLWTRLYIVSTVAGLPDQKFASARLLQNQKDIGNAIKPFYGVAAGDRLAALLRDHILIATVLIDASKSGDKAKGERAKVSWFRNADEIATFLSQANPSQWPLQDMRAMMHHHLNLTIDEVTARLQGKWQADVDSFQRVEDEILQMSDMLTAGIVRQFPQAFV